MVENCIALHMQRKKTMYTFFFVSRCAMKSIWCSSFSAGQSPRIFEALCFQWINCETHKRTRVHSLGWRSMRLIKVGELGDETEFCIKFRLETEWKIDYMYLELNLTNVPQSLPMPKYSFVLSNIRIPKYRTTFIVAILLFSVNIFIDWF